MKGDFGVIFPQSSVFLKYTCYKNFYADKNQYKSAENTRFTRKCGTRAFSNFYARKTD